MKKQVFSVIMVLCLCLGLLPTAALAEGGSTTAFTFTALDGTGGTGGEGYDKLIDGRKAKGHFSKWCVHLTEDGAYIIIEASEAIQVKKYILTTGNDNASATGRNPKSWELLGCNDYDTSTKSGTWTEIHKVENNSSMKDENYKDYNFDVSNAPYYKYYKLHITAVQSESDTFMQLGELTFNDYGRCSHSKGYNADGKCADCGTPASAKIEGQFFEDLQDAIDSADGKTVTLLNNVTLTKTLTVDETITLDLNGHTLTGAAGAAGTDGNNGGSGGTGGTAITVKDGGSLTVSGSGTISGGNGGDGGNGSSGSGTGGNGGSAITVESGGSLTVSGSGTISGGSGGIGGIGGYYIYDDRGIGFGDGGTGGNGGSAITVGNGGSLTVSGDGTISGGNGNTGGNSIYGGNGGNGGSGLSVSGGTVRMTGSNTISGGTGGSGGSNNTGNYGHDGNGGNGGNGLSVSGGIFYGSTPESTTIKKDGKTVTFKKDNTTVYAWEVVPNGGKATKPTIDPTNDHTKTDCIFSGWYTDETYKAEFEFSTATVDTDITLYAKWKTMSPVIVKATDITVYVGDAMPTLTYTATGLIDGEDLGDDAVTLTCEATDTTTAGSYTITPSGEAVIGNYTVTYETGTLTVENRPSGGGGGGGGGGGTSTPSITVPVSSDGGSVSVKATVKNGNAKVEVSDKQISQVIADGATNVTVDLSGLKKVTSATLPAHVLEKTNEAEGTGLTVALPAGSVTLDETALTSVTENADGEDVTVSVVSIPTAGLPQKIKDIIGMEPAVAAVVDVNLYVNGQKQSSFNGGKVRISIPYTPKKGEDTSKLTVWFINDNGRIENKGGYYDAENQCFVFETEHLSQYLLVSVEAVSFTDVPADAYYADAVAWAVLNGITTGMTETTFGPDESCTRAQIVTFLWRAAGQPEPNGTKNPFTDVNESDYFYKAVAWAVENGITTGVTETSFAPQDTCTRAQAAAFLYRNEQANGGGLTDSWMFQLPFTDVPEWCYEAVAWCYQNGIIQGTSETTFSPESDCTRAQMMTMLYRAEL